jgi:undecaprenyl diphosphate synthase
MTDTPHHLAIIMDGNRRWARERGWQVLRGHNQGAETLKKTSSYAFKCGVRWMTVFAFSSQNWSRQKSEVDGLMKLMRKFLMSDVKEMVSENVKFRAIGRRDRLPVDIVKLIEEAEGQTKSNTGLNLTFAIDYGGQQEVVDAAKLLAEEVVQGIISTNEINEDLLKSRMSSSMLPCIDLLIRTGGEYRVSNFMLWDISYAELHFSPVHWPEFDIKHLDQALRAFAMRERRFGGDANAESEIVTLSTNSLQ